MSSLIALAPIGGAAPTITSPFVHADGWPEPSQDILQRLAKANPRLAIRFYPAMRQWGITVQWDEFDARRELVKRGEISPHDDYDLLILLPRDCGVEEACGFVATRLQQMSDPRVRQMAVGLFQHNETHFDRMAQPWVEKIMDDVETVAVNRRRPTVFLNDTEARTTRLTSDRQAQQREDALQRGDAA